MYYYINIAMHLCILSARNQLISDAPTWNLVGATKIFNAAAEETMVSAILGARTGYHASLKPCAAGLMLISGAYLAAC
jgi:hypothetical protein